MGKIRKSKKPRRSNQSSNDEPAIEISEESEDSKENVVQTILDQLQAANMEEKYCGLQTLALLIESPENVEHVLSRGVVKSAAPLLLDEAGSVRNAAAGALRNLSTVGLDTCDALLDQDIMTPLVCYFHEHAEKWIPESDKKKREENLETLIQCINLLWNLCESSDLAVKYLGQSRILDILPKYLEIQTFGTELVAAVLQCLFVVVEDNPLAMEKVKANCESQLQQLLASEGDEPSTLLIRTLSVGVTINTCGGQLANLPVAVVNKLIQILSMTLKVDHRMVCNQLTNVVPIADGSGKVNPPQGKEAEELDKQLKAVSLLLDAQQSSVEIVANICSGQGGDDDEDDDDSFDSDEMAEEETCNGDTSLLEDKLTTEVVDAMSLLQIFELVWARAQLPAENVMLILKEYQGSQLIHKKLHNLQTRSLLCVNNMLSSLPIEKLGGVSGVYKIWVDAGKLTFKQGADNMTLLESATAVMRAALDKIKCRENGKAEQNNLFSELALSDIEIMLTGIRECQVPEIRSNLIRMVGILALLLVNNLNDATSNVICTITEFILEQAHKENEVWVLAEAVDTLVDLYSEDETDGLAAKVKLVEKLAVLSPLLRNKARQQKRLPKEYKVLVSTAAANLPRFIKYKKARISKLSVT